MQIYRGMDIGTAKVTQAEMQGVTASHDRHSRPLPRTTPSRATSRRPTPPCADILARGRLPIVAGGTNLYIDSLIARGSTLPKGRRTPLCAKGSMRSMTSSAARRCSSTLRGFDPERAAKLHPADKRRIVRADRDLHSSLARRSREHDEKTGKRPKALRRGEDSPDLCRPRRAVRQDKGERVDKMVADGLFDEVKGLLDTGLSPGLHLPCRP